MRIFFGGWILLIIGLSLAPLAVKSHLTIGPWHDAGHSLIFLVATVLGCWTMTAIYARLLCCVGLAGMAMALEGVEKLITYRNPFEWRDVKFDFMGILAGILLALLLPVRSAATKHTA
jgi:hypothetical protein